MDFSHLERLGYQHLHLIGRGGQSEVFGATETVFGRPVAIKVVPPRDPSHSSEALNEAVLAAASSHPNVMPVYSAGRLADGSLYLVMPMAHSSLDQRQGRVPLDELLEIGVTLAGALATVHASGVVHGDVKPANVLFSDYGNPLLADFGAAHVAGSETDEALTLRFAAPEVLHGSQASSASDVFSLAKTLLLISQEGSALDELSGRTAADEFRIAIQEPLDRWVRHWDVPQEVKDALLPALDTDPLRRPTAIEFGHALQQAQAAIGLGVTRLVFSNGPSEPGAEQIGPWTPVSRTLDPDLLFRRQSVMDSEVTVLRKALNDESQRAQSRFGREALAIGAGAIGVFASVVLEATQFPPGSLLLAGAILIGVLVAIFLASMLLARIIRRRQRSAQSRALQFATRMRHAYAIELEGVKSQLTSPVHANAATSMEDLW